MALNLELTNIFYLQVLSKQTLCMLLSFCDSFSYSSMPCSGCSALHRVNPNLNKEKKLNIKNLKRYFCFKTTSQYVSSEALHWLTIFYFVEKLRSVLKNSIFHIFNLTMIYQICDVMSISETRCNFKNIF